METLLHLPTRLVSLVQSRMPAERGAALLEYALLVGLIAMVAILSVTLFGDQLGDKNQGIAGSVADATD